MKKGGLIGLFLCFLFQGQVQHEQMELCQTRRPAAVKDDKRGENQPLMYMRAIYVLPTRPPAVQNWSQNVPDTSTCTLLSGFWPHTCATQLPAGPSSQSCHLQRQTSY